MEMRPEEIEALYRADLSTFIGLVFRILNPHAEFLPNWHLDLIASKLLDVMNGRVTRLIINIPPRNGKSIAVSVAFVAFLLGHRPSAKILAATYGQSLSEKNARDLKMVLQSAEYQALFTTRLSVEKQSAEEFLTTGGGSYFTTSVGGPMTGRGGDFIIIDDPLKPDEAVSDGQRKKVNDWFNTTAYTRLDDKRTDCIVIIMQRLHQDDLVGHVLNQEKWDVLSLPAIAEADEEHLIESPIGSYTYIRKAGEPLHPAREPLEVLEQLRTTLGEYNFSGQYQQRPAPMGGGLIKDEWFKYCEVLPDDFDQIVQSWDTASKASELSDYSVCTTWGLKGRNIYLIHVFRKKVLYPELKRAVLDFAREYSPNVILIEDKGSGTQVLQELAREGLPWTIKACLPSSDKWIRLSAQTGFFDGGFVYFPAQAHFIADFKSELLIFPKSAHDDQVDSTSQFLEFVKQREQQPPLVRYYVREAQKLRTPPSRLVRMRAPAHINVYKDRGGNSQFLDVTREIDVTEEAVRGLIMSGWVRVESG